jgi:cytochrome c-type biogenesis protein CcmF
MAPGQSTVVDGYTVKYARPVATASAAKVSLGSQLAIYHGGHFMETLTTTRGIYPTGFNGSAGPISEAFVGDTNGDADSNVAVDSTLTRDIWAVVSPTYPPWFEKDITQGDRVFEGFMTSLSPREARQGNIQQYVADQRARAIAGLAQLYVKHPWAVEFRIQVDPLVSWLWIGALIVGFGGLISLSPLPAFARRRAMAAAYASRLARDLA